MSMTVEIDAKGFVAGLKKLQHQAPIAGKFSAMTIAYEILRLSQAEVPHDKGSLQNSGTVDEVGDDIVVGYHQPYAARLHEHPEYRFKKGRKGKYLEDPIRRNEHILGLSFSKTIEEKLF